MNSYVKTTYSVFSQLRDKNLIFYDSSQAVPTTCSPCSGESRSRKIIAYSDSNSKAFCVNIVLIEPQIPQNTGNIARLCAATGSRLHLVGKLGFKTGDKYLKRAGLDYWKHVEIVYYKNVGEFERSCREDGEFFLLTTKGSKLYSDVNFDRNDYLIFGSETKGLPEVMRDKHLDRCIKIPILKETRSLNLATSVGIVLYEALRQTSFSSCQRAP